MLKTIKSIFYLCIFSFCHLFCLQPLLQSFNEIICIAAAFFGRTPYAYNHLGFAHDDLIRAVEDFCEERKKKKPNNRYTHLRHSNTIPQISDFIIDENIYRDIVKFPEVYGPMWITADMTSDGDVECQVKILRFEYKDNLHAVYDWYTLGKKQYPVTHTLIKTFLHRENYEKFEEIYQLIVTLPYWALVELQKDDNQIVPETLEKLAIAKYEKTFYKYLFATLALYRMSQKKIAPSLVIHAIRYGLKYQAKIKSRDIYQDSDFDVVVAVDREKRKILNVGYNRDITNIDLEPKPEPKAPTELLPLICTNNITENTPQENKPSIPEIKTGPTKTPEDIIAESNQEPKTGGKTTVFGKADKAITDMKNDFGSLDLKGVKDIVTPKGDKGKTGFLSDGRSITMREGSGDTRPTLEIYDPASGKKVKIRYGEKSDCKK